MAHILIAEKDEPVAKWLRRELALLGHTCCVAGDAQQAQALSHSEAFDLVLADAAMPELALAHTLLVGTKTAMNRRFGKGPLPAYIARPLQSADFRARIDEALMRACGAEAPVQVGPCRVDLARHRVLVDGAAAALTPQEYAVLAALTRHRGEAMSRDMLLRLAWGYDVGGDTRTVDVHIQKLRKKLHLGGCIQTVYKFGYRLNA